MDLGSTVAQFKILTPYPGTPLFKRMEPLLTETRLGALRRLHADVQSSHSHAATSCSSCWARRILASTCGRRIWPTTFASRRRTCAVSWSGSTPASRACTRRREDADISRLAVMLTAISRYGARVLPHDAGTDRGAWRRAESSSRGPQIAEFERAFAAAPRRRAGRVRVVRPHGLSTTSCRRSDLPAGSEIVFPALTFWVMPEIARVAGLTPVFADVDPATFNMTPDALRRVITPTHRRRRADAPVGAAVRHGRHPRRRARATSSPSSKTARTRSAPRYRGRPVGTLGDAALFSFQTLKPLNTYGGGMAVARDPVAGRSHRAISRRPSRRRPSRWSSKHLSRGASSASRSARACSLHAVSRSSGRASILERQSGRLPVGEDPSARPAAARLPRAVQPTCRPPSGLRILEQLDEWTAATQAHAAAHQRRAPNIPRRPAAGRAAGSDARVLSVSARTCRTRRDRARSASGAASTSRRCT